MVLYVVVTSPKVVGNRFYGGIGRKTPELIQLFIELEGRNLLIHIGEQNACESISCDSVHNAENAVCDPKNR